MMGRSSWLGSIRVRILVFVVVLLVVSSIGSVLALRTVLYERLDDEVETNLVREADEFRLLSTGNDPSTGEPFDGDIRAIFDTYFARELADEGESLLAFIGDELYEEERAQDAGEEEELTAAIDYWLSLDEPEEGLIDTPAGEARYVAIPLDDVGGDGLFVVANFPAYERDEIADAVRTHIIVQLLTMVLVGLLGLLIAGRILRPLTRLAATARTISDTDFERRIPVTGRDEASQIARAFNDMLDRLERAFAAQRRFLHDTSHELRTPLTVIRGHAELADVDASGAERRATLALLTDEVDRMTRLVNDLFLLGMAELPDFVSLAPLDARDVVLDTHRKASVLAERDWQIDAPAPVHVDGDAQRIGQALLQLAANAVTHTHDGDRIGLGVRERDGMAVLWVEDTGAGVAPELVGRITDRFARDDGSPGSGLGLSIVRAIAKAHGGALELVPSDAGARFEIILPRRR